LRNSVTSQEESGRNKLDSELRLYLQMSQVFYYCNKGFIQDKAEQDARELGSGQGFWDDLVRLDNKGTEFPSSFVVRWGTVRLGMVSGVR
jgi:hypothetical protein